MIDGALHLTLESESVWLHPARALLWPARSMVVVADTHFGKGSVFRRHGVAVPHGSETEDRARLLRLACDTKAEHIVVLGDFVHGVLEPRDREAVEIADWIEALKPMRLTVVVGNHDRSAARGWLPAVEFVSEGWCEGPFQFCHDVPSTGRFALSGHIHPVVRLGRRPRLRVPAFWLRRTGMIVPSFGVFTGGHAVQPDPGDQLFAVTPDTVLPVPGVNTQQSSGA